MRLFTIMATFCVVAGLFQLASCDSGQLNLRKSLKQTGNSGVGEHARLTPPLLRRNLKLQEEASSVEKGLAEKLMQASSGKKENKGEENVVNINGKGTWREWVEGPNKSEYFTMDYAWVRRRRPIHNKQIPFVP